MKEYSFSTADLEFLKPLEAVRTALEAQIKNYIVSIVLPRIGVKPGEQKAQYDIFGGKVMVDEIIAAKSVAKK